MTEHTPARSATLGGFGAIILWSITVPLARGVAEHVGPVNGMAAASAVGGGLAFFSLLRRRAGWPPRRYVLGCGALFVVYSLLLFLSVGKARNHQQVLEVGLVNYLWPAFTLVLSTFLLKRRACWILWPGTALALVGVVLALTHTTSISWAGFTGNVASNPLVYAMAITAAVGWAVFSNLTERWVGGHARGAVDLFLVATAAAFASLTVVMPEDARWNAVAAVEAVCLGLANFGGCKLWDLAMRRGNAVVVAAASYLTPLLSTLATCAYLGVAPGPRLWLGCAALVVGSFVSWRAFGKKATGVTGAESTPR